MPHAPPLAPSLVTTPPLALTMGDPAGIGPEIIAQLFASAPAPEVARSGRPPGREDAASAPSDCIVLGDVGAMARAVTMIGARLDVARVDVAYLDIDGDFSRPARSQNPKAPNIIRVVQVGDALPRTLKLGAASAAGGAASYAYVTAAATLALRGKVAGIVTAPINKASWHLAGHHVPGHTELLAECAGTTEFGMMLANDELRVMLVSIHVPLRRAIELVTQPYVLRAIRLGQRGARDFGVANPRVAVAGLNPHAGEGGLFGTEDGAIIAPAVADARAAGIDASGPHPPDTVFMRARAGEFDVVVAQYHDQGLIPVKYLGLDRGVNVTVGLPFVRTSVDHGTAYDIAGTGRANPSSLAYAVGAARRIVAARMGG